MSDASHRSTLSPDTALARGASVVGRFLKARANAASPYHSTNTLSPHSTPPITMNETSSLSSSPSLYSRRGSHISSQARGVVLPATKGLGVYADTDYESEEEEFPTQRLSMVSGPRLRKYADNPWGDDEDVDESFMAGTNANGLSRMIHAAKTRANSTHNSTSPTGSTMTATSGRLDTSGRRAMALFNKGKQIFPSASGGSLASSQTISTAASEHVVTPKLKSPFGGPPSPASGKIHPSQSAELGDHGHMSRDVSEETLQAITKPKPQHPNRAIFDSASMHSDPSGFPMPGANTPGFGLISLEQAQDRELSKNHRRTGTAHKIIPAKSTSKGSSTSTRSSLPDDAAPQRGISTTSTGSPLPPNRVKAKKSGIMKMFTKDKSTNSEAGPAVPKLPTPPLASSLRAAPHPVMPIKSHPSMDSSMDDTSSIRGSTHTRSTPSNVASPIRDKPLLVPSRSPPKKENQDRLKDFIPGPGLLGGELHKPRLELRPISMNFSNGFASDYLSAFGDASSGTSSPTKSAEPLTPSEASFTFAAPTVAPPVADEAGQLKESLSNARKGWRLQQFELEAQIRDLQLQLEDAKKPKPGGCDACGCTCGRSLSSAASTHGGGSVINRARAKTGGPRGVFGSGSLYEKQ